MILQEILISTWTIREYAENAPSPPQKKTEENKEFYPKEPKLFHIFSNFWYINRNLTTP